MPLFRLSKTNFHFSLYHVLLSLKRGTVSARNITLLIDYCVNYYCGLLFNIKYTFVNECFSIMDILSTSWQQQKRGFLYYIRTEFIPFATLKIRPNYFNVLSRTTLSQGLLYKYLIEE